MGRVIDGARCTKCCEAIMLGRTPAQLAKITTPGSDAEFILKHWRPMSKRLAKKKNPYLFKRHPALWGAKSWHMYRRTALKADGCSMYNERPQICSSYPNYRGGRISGEPEYHPKCTEWVRIDAVEIGDAAPKNNGGK